MEREKSEPDGIVVVASLEYLKPAGTAELLNRFNASIDGLSQEIDQEGAHLREMQDI